MKTLLIALTLFITGCQTAPLPPTETDVANVTVHWMEFNEVHKYAKDQEYKQGRGVSGKITGYSEYRDTDNGRECHVYAIKPHGVQDYSAFHVLGHEVFHCFQGSFH